MNKSESGNVSFENWFDCTFQCVCVCDSALTCFFAPFDKNGLVTLKLLLTPHFLEEKILVRFSFL